MKTCALRTFELPLAVTGSRADETLGNALVDAWRKDGIFQVAAPPQQQAAALAAFAAGRRHGKAFAIFKDLPPDDLRVEAGWPCHGPVAWPDEGYRRAMTGLMAHLGSVGDRLLRLVALGLMLDGVDALARLTVDGWHHMRVLRYPAQSGGSTCGLTAHTDYGLLVITAQQDVGGLYVRPPVRGEKRARSWLASEDSTGMYEHDEPWHLVKPVPGVFPVFPGDLLQFITGGFLTATPHKVRLAKRERFALAYFHEPHFNAVLRPLCGHEPGEYIHYGTHFTNACMRSYRGRKVHPHATVETAA